jgi:TonB dependent receptor
VRLHLDAWAVAVLLLAVPLPVRAQHVRAGADQKPDDDPRLADVLQSLQARGLRIVFSSSIVTPDMRVRLEPGAATPRAELDEILAPHGLVAREGPGGILQIVRAPRTPGLTSSPIPPLEQQEIGTMPAPLPVYVERITVTSPWPWWPPVPAAAEETVNRRELAAMPAGLMNDPVQAIRSMPRVAALADYRSEFVVRASPYRHAEVVVDGVSTSWLRHAPAESASVSMFTTQMLESATLRAGAYARTYGDRLGPQLELTLREGSRDGVHISGTVANTAATVVAEGPIGRARGSWIAAARQSLLEWPGEDLASVVPVFGFRDAVGKLVFDVNSHHQFGFSVLTGRSRVDTDEDVESGASGQPAARTSVANVSWRSAIGSTAVLTQRAYLIRQEIATEPGIPSSLSPGSDEEMVYRAALVTRMPLGMLQSGAQVGRTSWHGADRSASEWTRSGYLNLQARAWNRLTLSPGVRVSSASHVAGAAVSPWLQAEVGTRHWTIAASTGVSHQFPEVGRAQIVVASERLQPERAVHADLGIRRQLTSDVGLEATVYRRSEQDILDGDGRRLAGSAQGVELVIERRNANGLSGWGAYSYGRARYSDPVRGETFWADFDQRHAVSVFGMYRWPDSTTLGASLRLGTGVPMGRNGARLSTYSRFDVRVDRAFRFADRRLHGFVEIVNLFNRTNIVERLTPRRLSAGVTVGF